jgi:hypothetical protein
MSLVKAGANVVVGYLVALACSSSCSRRWVCS